MSEEYQDSDYECLGCGRNFPGPWSMDMHYQKCRKALLIDEANCRECGARGCNGECFGDDMMGASS